MKFFVLLIFILFVFCFWHFFLNNRMIGLKSIRKFNLIKNIKFEKEYSSLEQRQWKAKTELNSEDVQHDIQLFDQIANLMFEKELKNQEFEYADQIQYEFLNKMPTQARSEIQQFSLGDWSIFWTYKAQSLEYYVSKYGVFYTHVDRNGVEHTLQLKDSA